MSKAKADKNTKTLFVSTDTIGPRQTRILCTIAEHGQFMYHRNGRISKKYLRMCDIQKYHPTSVRAAVNALVARGMLTIASFVLVSENGSIGQAYLLNEKSEKITAQLLQQKSQLPKNYGSVVNVS